MDLVPKPDQLVAAAGNVAHVLMYGGLADLRPMPRTLIDEGTLREVYGYEAGWGELGPALREEIVAIMAANLPDPEQPPTR